MNVQRVLIWIGDFGCASGFERGTRYTLAAFHRAGWKVVVLGLNYNGDEHGTPYTVYRAAAGGDFFGVKRIAELTQLLHPDLIIIQNDPWNVKCYTDEIRSVNDAVPIMATLAVDGQNIPGEELNELSLALFWTAFGAHEAKACGYTGSVAVVPLGVDLDVYRPRDKRTARTLLEVADGKQSTTSLEDVYIVGNVNRNQPRKRLDLTVRYFCKWVTDFNIKNAYLYLHVCPTGDQNGHNVRRIMRYYGLRNRLIVHEPHIGFGVSETEVASTYAMFDVQVNTGQGEGFGLTTLEGMACGIPQIVPNWAAFDKELGWTGPAVRRVPCTSTSATLDIGVIGGVVDEFEFIRALQDLYVEPSRRESLGRAGLAWAQRSEFNWENVGTAFLSAVEESLKMREEALV